MYELETKIPEQDRCEWVMVVMRIMAMDDDGDDGDNENVYDLYKFSDLGPRRNKSK